MLAEVRARYENTYAALYGSTLNRWNGDAYMASFMTAAGLAGAMGMNVVFAIGVFVSIFGPVPSPKWLFFAIAITLLWLNYNAFVRHDRYEEITRRFNERPDVERRRTIVVAWTYVVASFVAPLAFFLIMASVEGA